MIKLNSTKQSSHVYGNCEKCGSFCTEVFHVFGFDGERYRDVFGCKECCQAVKKDAEKKLNYYVRMNKIPERRKQ